MVFLGDVFSDGFQASDEEWTNYLAVSWLCVPIVGSEVLYVVRGWFSLVPRPRFFYRAVEKAGPGYEGGLRVLERVSQE